MSHEARPGNLVALTGVGPGVAGGSSPSVLPTPAPVLHVCALCLAPFTGRCVICEGPACRLDDLCYGCGLVVCESCESDPDLPPTAFNDEPVPHPHCVGLD